MVESRNTHWTDDDELLSEFVLHRLPASEEKSLSSHLDTCEKCRKAVKKEATVVAGARLAGRAVLKERLRIRLSESEHRAASTIRRPAGYEIPWTHIASVAAVVTILITVGVYNNWFISDSWNRPAPQEGLAQKQEPPAIASDKKESKESPPEKLLGKGLGESTRSAGQYDVDDQRVKRTESFQKKEREDMPAASEESATSAAAEPAGNAGAGTVTVEGRRAKNELRSSDDAMVSSPQAFWVEGYVIPDISQEGRGMLSATPGDQVTDLMKYGAEAKGDVQQLSKTQNAITMNTISLSQEPSSSLPVTLQYRPGRQGIIQTLIENKDNAIQMTLYFDSPVADSELRSANIELVDADSLILNLPSQRIGLRLPPALQSQVHTKARQVR